MSDVFTAKKRSEIMARVRSRGNRATELRLIKIFREYKITGWRRHAPVFGSPDFIFRPMKLAVFVDGCFWHGCPIHRSVPATNTEFWTAKLERNMNRDRMVVDRLHARGWRVLRIWQHELRHSDRVAQLVKDVLSDEL